MEEKKKYYGGLLFKNERKVTDKDADYRCLFEIPPEMMRELVTMAKNGNPVKFAISGRKKTGVKGPFIALSPYIPRPAASSSNYDADASPRGSDDEVAF